MIEDDGVILLDGIAYPLCLGCKEREVQRKWIYLRMCNECLEIYKELAEKRAANV